METSCCIESVYGMLQNFRTVRAVRIFIEKGMVNDYWIVWVIGI